MSAVLEESVENFVNQWRDYALNVSFYARPEGSPLLELKAKQHIMQVFERTNPYAAPAGAGRAIIHALIEDFTVLDEGKDEGKKEVTITGVSQLEATGVVLEQRPRYLVVDVGIPLVVGLINAKRPRHPKSDESEAMPQLLGQWLHFSNQAPLHGFVLSEYQESSTLRSDDYDEI